MAAEGFSRAGIRPMRHPMQLAARPFDLPVHRQPRARAGLPEPRVRGVAAPRGAGRPAAAAPKPPSRSIPRSTSARRSSAASTSSARSQRLRADLLQAEESIVSLESGLRGLHTRADAVSAVAEARIALERVSRSAPWRRDRIAEAREKLEGSRSPARRRPPRRRDVLRGARAAHHRVAARGDRAGGAVERPARDPRRPREPARRALRAGEHRRGAAGADAALPRALALRLDARAHARRTRRLGALDSS